jgi:protein SCO1
VTKECCSKELFPYSELTLFLRGAVAMRKLSAVFLAVATAVLFVLFLRGLLPAQRATQGMTVLSQTYISLHAGVPLQVPPLTVTNGSVFGRGRLQGHWSVVFFGFTACPLVCPKTLSLLSAVARNPESGILSGSMLPVFVSVDPEHDTPQRVGSYLSHFDSHIVGLTGSSGNVARFAQEIGAGYQPAGSLIDHSTSLFVVDPKGRLAGVLLRPSQPSQIVSDLMKLRRVYAEGGFH